MTFSFISQKIGRGASKSLNIYHLRTTINNNQMVSIFIIVFIIHTTTLTNIRRISFLYVPYCSLKQAYTLFGSMNQTLL